MTEEDHLNLLRALVAIYKTELNTGIALRILADSQSLPLNSEQKELLATALNDRTKGVEEFANHLEQALRDR